MDNRNIVGFRIHEARYKETPTATLKDLSARLQLQGVALSDSAIGKIEKGIRPVTDIQIAAFSKALKVSISWLFEESVK